MRTIGFMRTLGMMGLALLCAPASGLAHAAAPGQPARQIEGIWQGSLDVPGGTLRIVFHIERAEDGTFAATLDSPDQGATGIPVSSVTLDGDSLRMEVAVIGGVYQGRLQPDGHTIDGVWTQGGMVFPLRLEHTDEAPVPPKRPQDPAEPVPYAVEEVRFENAEAGITLAGTLTRPHTGGPHPAVVLVSGSGPQDRDEALAGHRPFLVLADYLTRRGIAVLRYDDRGVGASTGTFAGATTEDFAADALAAVHYLAGRGGIDAARIGIAGHSEGGLVAPMAANRSEAVAFAVLLAGPGLPGRDILRMQGRLVLAAGGASEDALDAYEALQLRLFAVLDAEPGAAAADRIRAEAQAALAAMPAEIQTQLGFSQLPEEALLTQFAALASPWMRYFLRYDPRPALQQLRQPVLALLGGKDLQVPAEENRAALEAALQAGGHEDYAVVVLPGLNHLFQPAATGAPAEYAQIETTIDEAALAAVADWILDRFGHEK